MFVKRPDLKDIEECCGFITGRIEELCILFYNDPGAASVEPKHGQISIEP